MVNVPKQTSPNRHRASDAWAKSYEPLGSRQTRVFAARLSFEGSVKITELCIIDLDDPNRQHYYAISYTWGDRSETVRLCFTSSGVELTVTESCIFAIRDVLRSGIASGGLKVNQDRFLWIDQISIDQSNEEEKAAQIALMKSVYENAISVRAWIGYPSEDSGLAMDTLMEMENHMRSVGLGLSHIENYHALAAFIGSVHDAKTLQKWHSVSNLVKRQYFRRAWIIQEITARANEDARHRTLVICGRNSIDYEQLESLCILAEIVQLGLPGTPESVIIDEVVSGTSLNNMVMFNLWRQNKHGMPLLRLVEVMRHFDLTDERDRFACLLPFATDVHDPEVPFEIRYSSPPEDTYIRFAIWHIRKYCSLDILSYVAEPPGKFADKIPSWVPDWTAKKETTHFELQTRSSDPSSAPLFCASGTAAFTREDQTENYPSGDAALALAVPGVRLCSVGGSVSYLKSTDREPSNERDLHEGSVDFGDRICLLNGIPLNTVWYYTFTADTYKNLTQGEGNNDTNIWGRVSKSESALNNTDERSLDDRTQRASLAWKVACGRCLLFGTRSPPDEVESWIIGVGPESVQPGEGIWALKGGKVLYVLREYTMSQGSRIDVFDVLSGQLHSKDLTADDAVYQVLGEVFMYGLMDGEILDMMGDTPKRSRPSPLADMDRDFHTIYLM